MSMPIINTPENPINREQSVNDLIESVALIETGLSHIINAEGEKIQKVIQYDSDTEVPLDDIIRVNESAEKMVNAIYKLEMLLQSKLDNAKNLDEFKVGPPGPPGPPGPEGIMRLKGLQMQLKNNPELILNFDTETSDRVPFDTSIFDNVEGEITYDEINRSFNLTGPAIYKVDWFVAYEGSTAVYSVNFGLQFQEEALILNGAPVETGGIGGTALINCQDSTGTLKLKALQETALAYTAVQANIVINKYNE